MLQFGIMRTRFTDEDILFLKELGERVRILRKQANISQHNLATDTNMSKNQIGRIERAEISVAISDLNNIAKALGYDICGFFETSLEEETE